MSLEEGRLRRFHSMGSDCMAVTFSNSTSGSSFQLLLCFAFRQMSSKKLSPPTVWSLEEKPSYDPIP